MRQHGTRGGAFEARVEAEIDVVDDVRDALVAGGEPRQNSVASFAAMGDEGLDEGLRIVDRGAVRRPINGVVTVQQLFERAHIGRHVAVGRRDDARRPPHDMIAGEERALFGKREAEMVRSVARRMNRRHAPTRSRHDIAVAQGVIGTEVVIAAFFGDAAHTSAILGAARAVGTEAVSGGARHVLQRRRRRRVIDMGMGDENVRHGLAGERFEQRFHMRGDCRAGIDDGDAVPADDVGAGALEGEGARVARDDAADERAQRGDGAVLDLEIAAEGNLNGHGAAIADRSGAAKGSTRVRPGFNRRKCFSTRCQDSHAASIAKGSAIKKSCHHVALPPMAWMTIACTGQP
jgi:hypothetical protein